MSQQKVRQKRERVSERVERGRDGHVGGSTSVFTKADYMSNLL